MTRIYDNVTAILLSTTVWLAASRSQSPPASLDNRESQGNCLLCFAKTTALLLLLQSMKKKKKKKIKMREFKNTVNGLIMKMHKYSCTLK